MIFPRSLLGVIGSIGLLAGCGSSAPEGKSPSPMPTLATAVASAVPGQSEQVWDGVVEAVNQATISAQTSGRVIELPYDVNDSVDEGAVIVRFTDVEQKSAKSRSQSQIASA